MAEVPLQRQFAGQARLVRLLLWRVGDSTDIGACLRTAVEAAMLTADDVAFLRECLDAEERQRALDGSAGPSREGRAAGPNGAAEAAGAANAPAAAVASPEGPVGLLVDEQLVARLRRCADKLNRADAA